MKLTKDQKLGMSYAVKGNSMNHKEVSITERTVNVIANTYNYMDSDADVLVKGCCAKSIQERGPESKMPGKIKHLSNHNLSEGIGKIEVLEETEVNGNEVLRAFSHMSETDKGEETLIKYNEGIIDQHSIGFQYMQLEFLEQETDDFDKILNIMINPDEAIKQGYMWLVKEIKLYEFSSLDGFGSNRLTPFLGSKSDNKTVQYNNLVSKLDTLHGLMKSGNIKDKYNIELQEAQIKQMIYELFTKEPSLKDTYIKPSNENTLDLETYLNTHKILK